MRLAGQNKKLRMKQGYSQTPENVRTGNVAYERKEKADKDVTESKIVSGIGKKPRT